jgi:hypothetical protein
VGDEEFEGPSKRFFGGVLAGRYVVLVSEVVYGELRNAPDDIREVIRSFPPGGLEEIQIDDTVRSLADAYIEAGVVGSASRPDALHMAAATVGGADLILSWNFKHIVNYDRIQAFNSVNLRNRYRAIDIRSPLEMDEADEGEDI